MALKIMLIVIVAMMISGFPIYSSILIGSLAYFVANPMLANVILTQRMMNAMNTFTFLAVPFFMLAGQIMNRGGITKRIFHFADTLVGHLPGGLGYVNILSSFIFSGMSGSALADIGGLGVIEIQAMEDAGYDKDFSLGVTAASSTIGPIVPPSLPMVNYSLFSNVSLGALFMAGFMPGIALVFTLSVMTLYYSTKRHYPRGRKYRLKEILKAFGESFPALMSPVLLIGGIWSGWVTPTEAALACVVYSILIGVFYYHDTTLSELPGIFKDSLKSITPCTSLILASTVMAFIFNYEGLNKILYFFISGITDSKYVFLLIINVFLLFLGMVMDPSATSVVLVPILAPIAQAYGVNLIHFGVMYCLNIMVGLLTPPVGMSLFLLSSVSHRSFREVTRAVSPWLIPLVAALIIVTYWEGFVLFIPRLVGIVV